MDDRRALDLAARLAFRAAGDVEPNPMVGAVIVSIDGRVIGLGHHRRFGGLHAEREALTDCTRRGHSPAGATMYVTLEPCNHIGKQPPCTEAIIAAKLAEVVVARLDPHPAAAGGAARLRAAGISVLISAGSRAATRLTDPFVHRVQTRRPWVIAKWAQTIDGATATREGRSKWISGEEARWHVHRLRARVDAVMCGIGTVLADDPLLTARGVGRVRRLAERIVIDPGLDIPPACRLVQSAPTAPVMIACRDDAAAERPGRLAQLINAGVQVLTVPPLPSADGQGAGARLDLKVFLERLVTDFNATNVLVEGGSGLIGSLLAQDLIDEALVFIGPKMLGDGGAMPAARGRVAASLDDCRAFELTRVKRLHSDVQLGYRRLRSPGA